MATRPVNELLIAAAATPMPDGLGRRWGFRPWQDISGGRCEYGVLLVAWTEDSVLDALRRQVDVLKTRCERVFVGCDSPSQIAGEHDQLELMRSVCAASNCRVLWSAPGATLVNVVEIFEDLYLMDGPIGLDASATPIGANDGEVLKVGPTSLDRLPSWTADSLDVVAMLRVQRDRPLAEYNEIYVDLAAGLLESTRFSMAARLVDHAREERGNVVAVLA